MEKARELQKELEQVAKDFQLALAKQQKFAEKCRERILFILTEFMSRKLRVALQQHFENRNELLEGEIRCIDEAINAASFAHDEFVNLRCQLIRILNEATSPEIQADSSMLLVANHGTSDFQSLSSKTKAQVVLVNGQQERYETYINQTEEQVLNKVSKTLQEIEEYLHEVQILKRNRFEAISSTVLSEIEKHVRLGSTFQIMQNQMDSLCGSFQAPL